MNMRHMQQAHVCMSSNGMPKKQYSLPNQKNIDETCFCQRYVDVLVMLIPCVPFAPFVCLFSAHDVVCCTVASSHTCMSWPHACGAMGHTVAYSAHVYTCTYHAHAAHASERVCCVMRVAHHMSTCVYVRQARIPMHAHALAEHGTRLCMCAYTMSIVCRPARHTHAHARTRSVVVCHAHVDVHVSMLSCAHVYMFASVYHDDRVILLHIVPPSPSITTSMAAISIHIEA